MIASFDVNSQDYTVRSINGINTENDEIISTVIGKQVVFCTNYRQDLLNDYNWSEHFTFRQETATRQNTFDSYDESQPFLHRDPRYDEGPSCFITQDSALYFSSANNYGKSSGKHLKIFISNLRNGKWTTPEMLPFCNAEFDYAHPYFDPISGMLVFSSNRPGTNGGMDIWITYKSGEGWTDPINPGIMVNTRSHELFPTLMSGDIYYSSNGSEGPGGYDLYKALRKDQYQVSIQLGVPVNSAGDDIRIMFLSKEKGLLTSNREGGVGGDDIYLVELEPTPADIHNYTACLEKDGKRLEAIPFEVINSLEEIILDGTTGTNGMIDIHQLWLSRPYQLKLKVENLIQFSGTMLHIMDDEGKKIQSIRMGNNGMFEFELLPFDNTLAFRPTTDASLLTIRIAGQVYSEAPGDVGTDEMISIVDEKGEVVAIAYTKEAGKFDFNELSPELNYTFRLAKESEVNNVLVFDKGEKLVLPVLQEEAVYHRLKANEAIRIVNELNQTLYVSPEDVFVINRIYYTYNSSQLSEQAQEQLEQLVAILKRNPRLSAELISYTDSRGNDQYNLALSSKRAKEVIEYLVKNGVDRKRLSGKGMGENGLLNDCAANCSEQEHAINRRTEIHLLER